MEIRFHLDESVSIVVARALHERSIDATTPAEAGLLSATDEEHLSFALNQGRTVITHDVDYLRLHAAGEGHAGIVYCHQQKYRLGELIRMILLVHDCLTAEQLRGKVEFL